LKRSPYVSRPNPSEKVTVSCGNLRSPYFWVGFAHCYSNSLDALHFCFSQVARIARENCTQFRRDGLHVTCSRKHSQEYHNAPIAVIKDLECEPSRKSYSLIRHPFRSRLNRNRRFQRQLLKLTPLQSAGGSRYSAFGFDDWTALCITALGVRMAWPLMPSAGTNRHLRDSLTEACGMKAQKEITRVGLREHKTTVI
jgi:hypothetical protein